MRKTMWIILPVLAATAFAFLADAICPGALNWLNRRLIIGMYIVAGYAIAER